MLLVLVAIGAMGQVGEIGDQVYPTFASGCHFLVDTTLNNRWQVYIVDRVW